MGKGKIPIIKTIIGALIIAIIIRSLIFQVMKKDMFQMINARIKFFLTFFVMFHLMMGQVTLDGIPYTKYKNIENDLEKIILDTVPVEILLAEDKKRAPGTPFRYGYVHETEFNPNNSGSWRDLEDGSRIWQIHFQSNDAYAINIEYDKSYLVPDQNS